MDSAKYTVMNESSKSGRDLAAKTIPFTMNHRHGDAAAARGGTSTAATGGRAGGAAGVCVEVVAAEGEVEAAELMDDFDGLALGDEDSNGGELGAKNSNGGGLGE